MCVNEIGALAYQEWVKTPEIRPDMNIELGAFIVMPNHVHGIIEIGENEYNRDDGTDAMHCTGTDAMHCVSNNKFGPQSKNLGSIIRGFKSAITTNARDIKPNFGWQLRFHDHIIRDGAEYQRISNYIIHNPENWKEDKFCSK